MIYLLITADDFGKSPETNRAIKIGTEEGMLTSASLMVVGDKWEEAVEIAQEKDMDIGLHVSLTEGKGIFLNKRMDISPSLRGFSAQFCKKTISWIEKEISLQIKRLALTGLSFSHVDSHHHIHIHPRISKVLLRICKEYGIKSIRLPYEPWHISSPICNTHYLRNLFYMLTFSCLSRRLARGIRSAGLISADGVFGLYKTGEITEDWLLLLLERLQGVEGVFEIYLHPEDKRNSPGYNELKSITSPKVMDKIKEIGAKLIGFSDLIPISLKK
ncbi:MAG: hypothetical protein DRG39_05950 [Deltaproteobacteria bacterium]|nr:MAG: hypothetical protein DRG39_05950 [Deltaproteobacteria bacterium]